MSLAAPAVFARPPRGSSDCREYTYRRIEKICLTSEHSIGMSGHSWITPLTVHVCSTAQTLRTRCQSRLRTRHMLSPSPAPPPTRRPSSRSKCRMPPQALSHVLSTARACPASKTSASEAMAARRLLGRSPIRLLLARWVRFMELSSAFAGTATSCDAAAAKRAPASLRGY